MVVPLLKAAGGAALVAAGVGYERGAGGRMMAAGML